MSLVHGPLSDAIGRRRVILAGLFVFALASAGCALSHDLTTLLGFRALQGLSAGVGLIVGRAVIRDVLHGDDAQRLMSQVSMIFGIAPAIAPVIGGWILGWSAWPVIFWFLVVFSIVLWFATLVALPETHPQPARLPLAREAVCCATTSRSSSTRASSAWPRRARSTSARCSCTSRRRRPSCSTCCSSNERSFGWFFVPMIGGMMLGAFTSGRIAGKIDGTTQVRIGFACCGVAAALNIAYNLFVDVPTVPWAVLPMMLNSFGIALVFPIVTLAILDMYPRQRGRASSLQAFTGLVSNAVIAGILSPLLSQHAVHWPWARRCSRCWGGRFWRWEMHVNSRMRMCAAVEVGGLEPTERL